MTSSCPDGRWAGSCAAGSIVSARTHWVAARPEGGGGLETCARRQSINVEASIVRESSSAPLESNRPHLALAVELPRLGAHWPPSETRGSGWRPRQSWCAQTADTMLPGSTSRAQRAGIARVRWRRVRTTHGVRYWSSNTASAAQCQTYRIARRQPLRCLQSGVATAAGAGDRFVHTPSAFTYHTGLHMCRDMTVSNPVSGKDP